MDKISISDFCGEEKTYAQLIQDLYFHISVKELYSYYLKVVRQRQKVFLTTAGIYFESFRQLF